MKALRVSLLLAMILGSSSLYQSEAQNLPNDEINVPVRDLNIEAQNIHLLLSKIAYLYSVPISLEVASDDELLKSKHLKVQIKTGTLANVLDTIVRQKPSYIWEVSEHTIRVFPKSQFRDSMLPVVLDLRISHLVAAKPVIKFTFRQQLTQQPELKNLLESYGVTASLEAFSGYDFRPFGRDFSFDFENVSVRTILNSVIRNSETKYWVINRFGENREYLLINF